MNPARGIISLAGLAIAAIACLTIMFGSWYTVDQQERAVVTRNGAVVDEAGPGLHFKTPWLESIHKFDVTTTKLGYKQAFTFHSFDQQEGTAWVSLNYHIAPDKVREVYSAFGDSISPTKIEPTFGQEIGVAFGKVTAQQIINNRDTLSATMVQDLSAALAPYNVVVETVQVEKVDFNQHFTDSINALIQQEVAVRTQKQLLEQEKINADIAVTKATGAANSAKAAADGESYRIMKLAEAQSEAIRKQGDALRSNPLFVELTKANKWDGKLPLTMIPNGTTPIMDFRAVKAE
jgi:regulator of protease activity HflC (stomatin/prohibitin superfamily)